MLVQLLPLALFGAAAISQSLPGDGLVVSTSTGTYTGLIDNNTPNVRQFRNIPYSLPPTGNQRWLPPVQITGTANTQINATEFPPACPQYISRIPSVYNQDVTQYLIQDGSESVTAGQFAGTTSEDCLRLAVWTPKGNVSSLPVLMFMTGGGFVTGGINIPYQLPHRWVQRTQAHIVVTINYRVNIMGFPNAAGLKSNNLGLLDQRMALEWVRDNIEGFGGDPKKITLWGQSAGASSVDFQNFAFPKNPIATGLFMQSGTVLLPLASSDLTHSNFSFVASHLGCGGLNSTAELTCMRKVPVSAIENFVGHYQDNSSSTHLSQPPIAFTPVPDEVVVFANYTQRYEMGAVAKIPAIVSNTADEGVALIPYPTHNTSAGPSQIVANDLTLGSFVCPSTNTSALRYAANVTTYRYQFAGNFSNVSPRRWMGPYHASDLPMMFDSFSVARGNGTAFEAMVSETMEDFVLAFAKDPVSGPSSMGWVPFVPSAKNGGMILRFGADGKVVQNATGTEVDGACLGIGTYNPTP